MSQDPAVEASIRIRGRVQGVGFRPGLRREAEARGVRGWVRNLPDGSVEGVLQGPRAAVEAVIAWARRGPPLAAVESVDVSWSEPTALFPTFEVRV